MTAVNIQRRNVVAEQRNGRIPQQINSIGAVETTGRGLRFYNGLVQSGSTVSFSGSYSGSTFDIYGGTWSVGSGTTSGSTVFTPYSSGYTGNTVTINGNLFVDGNITASRDVIAYLAGEVSSGLFDGLSVSQPLSKSGSNITFQYDSSQFTVDNGKLKIINASSDWQSISNKPNFATVATTGSYQDLLNKPDLSGLNLFYLSGDTIYSSGGYNLHIDGNISASKDIIAYLSGVVSGDLLAALSVSQPLVKDGSNIGLNINSQYLEVLNGSLSIKPNTVAAKQHTHTIADVENLQTTLNNKATVNGLTSGYLSKYNGSALINSGVYEVDNQIFIGTTSGNATDILTISGNTQITGDLYVDGNITASRDVIAYLANEVSSGIYDGLSVSTPLVKSGSNIGLNINNQQFEVVDNSLNIKAGVLTPAEHRHSSLYKPDGSTAPLVIDASGNVIITTDIYQNGSTYTTHAQDVYTTTNQIILRDGAVAGLGAGEFVGLTAKLYDGVNDGQLVFDNQGWARVGDVGSLQKIATIEETPVNNSLLKYDTNSNKLVSTGINIDGANNIAIGNNISYLSGIDHILQLSRSSNNESRTRLSLGSYENGQWGSYIDAKTIYTGTLASELIFGNTSEDGLYYDHLKLLANGNSEFIGNLKAPTATLTTGAFAGSILSGDASGNITHKSINQVIGGSYIQNQNSAAQTANMWINGAADIDNSLTIGRNLSDYQFNIDSNGRYSTLSFRNTGVLKSQIYWDNSTNETNFTSAAKFLSTIEASGLKTTRYSRGSFGYLTDDSTLIFGRDVNYDYGISTNAAGGMDIIANQAGQAIRFYNAGTPSNPKKSLELNANNDALFSGKIGIGIPTPDSKLTILSPSTANQVLFNIKSGYVEGGNQDIFKVTQTGSDGFVDIANANGGVNVHLSGYNNTSYPSYILGNVGIGTTTPQAPFEVIGTIRSTYSQSTYNGYSAYMRGQASDDDAFQLGIGVPNVGSGEHKLITSGGYYNGSELRFWTNDTRRMTIGVNGNVGIGTTAPQSKLQIGLFGNIDGGVNGNIGTMIGSNVYYSDGYYALYGGNAIFSRYSNDGIDFYSQSVNAGGFTPYSRLRILTNGNVGVGTTTPLTKLHIDGGNDMGLTFESSAWTGRRVQMGIDVNASFNISETSGVDRISINNLGNVGIGFSSGTEIANNKLAVNGKALINGDLQVNGNINATGEVAAYITSAVTADVLAGLSVSQPLSKSGSNISFNYNSSHFEVLNGGLSLKTTNVDWANIQNKPALTSTIAGATDYSTYFNTSNQAKTAAYASNAGYADTANNCNYASTANVANTATAIYWSSIINPPATYAPSSHTIGSHSDVGSYFSGTKALTAANADNAGSLGGVAASSYYNSGNFNKSTVPITASTVNATTLVVNGWTISVSSGALIFNNGANRCKVDASGNLYASGDITAFASF